ncbi:MAG TPA: EAL domain-containing protein [Polyangiaceae bacterium]|jgi:EAL domain-containing protein (putative c-di-GMP-specific phosphodiesterase class I)
MSDAFGRSLASGVRPRRVADLEALHLDVAFQPIVDLRSGALFAVESLARCRIDDFRNPLVLFERAVVESCCGKLGRSVREVTFSHRLDLPMFVNLHPNELSEHWLVRPDDPLAFHEYGVYLEITESAAFTHFELCMGALKEICSRTGAHLAIDDLGAGHSNLKRIVDMEPDFVKLDLVLTRGIDKNRRQQILVTQVVKLCTELGARVVAEGIETVNELLAVRDTGAQFGQGYLLGRPANPVPDVFWPLGASPTSARSA